VINDPAYFEALCRISQPIAAGDLPRTLEPTVRLLAALGDPQARVPAVLVAGSVGKGSACQGLASLLAAGGLRIGLYTSPHLHSFRERFAILAPDEAPRLIGQGEFVELAGTLFAALDSLGASFEHVYSTFEQATALALLWFARRQVDLAVLEVGLGGRFDAVNAVAHDLALITPIESEHQAMLGGSLESIAWHKAGITPPGGAALTVPQAKVVRAALNAEAAAQSARLLEVADVAALTGAAYAELARQFPLKTPAPQVAPLPLAGRLEQVTFGGKIVIIDGGHTPSAARRLRAALEARGAAGVGLVIGMLRDKAAGDFLRVFDQPGNCVIVTTAPADRALTAAGLGAQADFQYAQLEQIDSLEAALKRAFELPADVIAISGSLRMAAAAREWLGLLTPEAQLEAEATRAIFSGADYLAKLKPPVTGRTESSPPAQ
jgi:dihydrofolate synthase/folylpolyglutamate synthase